jgi:hypothetical protein
MPKPANVTEEELQEYHDAFVEAARRLKSTEWFRTGWNTVCSFYGPENQRKGVSLQLFRATWLNEGGSGIHLECWLGNADHKRQVVPFALHNETNKARSRFSPQDFHQELFSRCREMLESWDGYELHETYASQPFVCKRPFSSETLVGVVEQEFSRMQRLGLYIDQFISDLQKGA